jgi:type IV secretory pathway VirB6-like protein
MYLRFLKNKKIVKKDLDINICCSFSKIYCQSLFFLSCIIFWLFLTAGQSHARCIDRRGDCNGIYEGVRDVRWNPDEYQQCNSDGIDFLDSYEESDNPYCIAPGAAIGLGSTAAGYGATVAGIAGGPATAIAIGAAIAAEGIRRGMTYGIASQVYHKTRICGHDWQVWSNIEIRTNEFQTDSTRIIWSHGSYIDAANNNKSYAKCLSDLFTTDTDPCNLGNKEKKISNKYYREYIYGGREYENTSKGSCNMPKWDRHKQEQILGYRGDKQRYYMRGSGLAANYACNRFLTDKSDNSAIEAYNCCNKISQNTICIEYQPAGFNNRWSFCRIGEKCTINGVQFEAYKSIAHSNYICAKTYSLCPYNHPIAGGSEVEDYDSKLGIRNNFCQYMNHCIKIPTNPYVSQHNLIGGFISKSCRDLKGDSQNNYVYEYGLLSQIGHNFSAPIVQCFKETIENMMVSRGADYFKCEKPSDKKDYLEKQLGNLIVFLPSLESSSDLDPRRQQIKAAISKAFGAKDIKDLELGLVEIKKDPSGDNYPKIRKAIKNNNGTEKILADVYNKLGSDIQESEFNPIKNGICVSGRYTQLEGKVSSYNSFFINIQAKFRGIVKMSLVLAIMFFGVQLLLGLGEVKKKKLISFIIKIAVVAYFAIGDGWQTIFEDGVTKISNLLSEIVMVVDPANLDSAKQDGCQFPKFDYKGNDYTKTNHFSYSLAANQEIKPSYPPGKEYLRIWDTLDCKISRAIGFEPSVSVPNLVRMILAGFLTSGAGIIFLVATLLFGFFLIALVVRAIHIFLISSIGITLLIYISPLTITLALFDKTKAVFDNWLRQLLGLVLQPVILFAYLGLLVVIFDSVIIGDATFSGDNKFAPRQIHCNEQAKLNSIYCIFDIAEIKTINTFSFHIGVGLPFLFSDNLEAKTIKIFQAALLMFVFTKFLDRIQELAMSLVSGPESGASWGSVRKMATKTYNTLSGIQQRSMRLTKKHGGRAIRTAGHKIGHHGNQGKRVKDKAPVGRKSTLPSIGGE